MTRTTWTKELDAELLRLRKRHGTKTDIIAETMGLRRTQVANRLSSIEPLRMV